MYHAIVFLPLIGALIAGFGGRAIGAKASEYVTTLFLIVAALLSWVAFFTVAMGDGEMVRVPIMRWMDSGGFSVDWALRIDTLTAVMLVVVNTVSCLVHVYSIGYMHHDPHRPRFFAYLSFFTFAMLMLVTSDNLLQMFFGWEGVGVASYLLIGFWYKKPSANAAAMKAFIVNRVGDFGFLLGIFGLFVLFGSVLVRCDLCRCCGLSAGRGREPGETVSTLFGMHLDKAHALTGVCLLLFMGAMGKSAQFLLHTWLPDAMEGPTPVSALIHAATMVTAGVFLVARMSPLFEHARRCAHGGDLDRRDHGVLRRDRRSGAERHQARHRLLDLFAARLHVRGARHRRLWRAIFHLFTHAFFKALLFLGAGSVIHAVSDEQDMRRMGGLRKKIPMTYWMMIIGTIALTGVGIPGTLIGTAGFFSKDAIIESPLWRTIRRRHRLRFACDRGAVYQLLFLAPDLHDLPRQAAGFVGRDASRP
jgi:NADH-quinone oxidoreductase subunit L